MSVSPFLRLLEDVLREEILTLGLEYDDVIDAIIEKRDGESYTIRFLGDAHDLEVVEPDELPTRVALGAHLRRKIRTALQGRGSVS